MAFLTSRVQIQKYAPNIGNYLTMLIAIGIMCISINLVVTYPQFLIFFTTGHARRVTLPLAISGAMLVTSFIGWLRGTKEELVLTIGFGACLVFLIIFSNFIMTITYNRGFVLDEMKLSMTKVLENYNNHDVSQLAWSSIQRELECCGIEDLFDWASMNVEGCKIQGEDFNFTVPFSCSNGFCRDIKMQGCVFPLEHYYIRTYDMTTIGLAGVFLLQLIVIYLAFPPGTLSIYCQSKSKQEVYEKLGERRCLLRANLIEKV